MTIARVSARKLHNEGYGQVGFKKGGILIVGDTGTLTGRDISHHDDQTVVIGRPLTQPLDEARKRGALTEQGRLLHGGQASPVFFGHAAVSHASPSTNVS